jgi:Domain of unknown function (DUF305)
MVRLRRSHFSLVGGLFIFLALALPLLIVAEQAATSSGDEKSFLQENETAMTKMTSDMMTKPTGDVDRDFVSMMIPHHQGAIDMAMLELRYGKNEQLRRLAQQIIVDQTQEIAAMKLAIGEPLEASAPVPTQPAPANRPIQTVDLSDRICRGGSRR